jgi:hypothetical protein
MISKHLDKNNLHHAYLIEGDRNEIVPEVLNFFENLNIKTSGNPDFCHIVIDNFKIDEAFELRAMSSDKSFSAGKKIFVVCVNSFSLDAQNVLLKMFEEPIENTHFFLVVPDINSLLKTLVSRFYVISTKQDLTEEIKNAEIFIDMSLQKRIDFLKDLLIEPAPAPEGVGVPTSDESQSVGKDSARSKALKFLNALEVVLQSKFLKNYERCGSQPVLREGLSRNNSLETCLNHFLKVREFLRMPGSSAKTLMESVALIIPVL